MGGLSSMLDFELFNLKDMWKKIEDNPESLILGVDPISTGFWNTLGVGGGNQEPLVNVFGGPMGGDTLGIGSGGVYDRAQASGINTKNAMQAHDLAEAMAAMYTMNWAGGQLGSGNNQSGGRNFGQQLPDQQSNQNQRSNFSEAAKIAAEINSLMSQLDAAQRQVNSARSQQERSIALAQVDRIKQELSIAQSRLKFSQAKGGGNANGGGQ